ncbi:hypothetical protein, partial [Bacteroides ovatus]|uniref:hypothetical protein n=1 Tax=Bacteroides ovatus TaxID=28116 RepID=UPI001E3075BD
IKRKAHVKQSFSLDFLERGTFTEYPYLVLSDVYGLFRQRVILTEVRKYSYTFEELFSLQ